MAIGRQPTVAVGGEKLVGKPTHIVRFGHMRMRKAAGDSRRICYPSPMSSQTAGARRGNHEEPEDGADKTVSRRLAVAYEFGERRDKCTEDNQESEYR